MKKIMLIAISISFVVFMAIALVLGLFRAPEYIQNFEIEEYAEDGSFIKPSVMVGGLAIYALGEGEPVLLFPYPHGQTTEPMVESPIAQRLVDSGRTVITFDPPGSFHSTRRPAGDMNEMLESAELSLTSLGIHGSVDVIGHSMGGLCALAFAIEHPDRTQRLILANSVSGFPAALKWGRIFEPTELDFWRMTIWGLRVNLGRGRLETHKKLENLMVRANFKDPAFFEPLEIESDDSEMGVPIRMIWNRNMYGGLSYADQLARVNAPTLVLAGRYDLEAPPPASYELFDGIPDARIYVFEDSGHFPFIEEADLFGDIVEAFLSDPLKG